MFVLRQIGTIVQHDHSFKILYVLQVWGMILSISIYICISVYFRQLQMFIQIMQTNPGILPALGSKFTAIASELEKMEKLHELEVNANIKLVHVSLRYYKVLEQLVILDQ